MKDPFSYRDRGIKGFFKENLVPILYTLIFHVVILIVLVFVRIEGLKQEREEGVMINFEDKSIEERLEEEEIELPPDFIEMINRQRELASNRAVNANREDPFNQEISTDDYLQQLLDEIEAGREEDIIRDREKWREILESGGYIEPVPEQEENPEDDQYAGPTTITYEFLEAPKDRGKSYLTIPVYKCQGGGLVKVEAEVARDGSVIRADIRGPVEGVDAGCFSVAAIQAALSSRFRVAPGAPERHRVLITYTFIPQ